MDNYDIKDPGVLRVMSLMGPRVLTVFFIQLVFIMQDNLASRLPTGSITALVYGWLFMQLPESLIGTALGTALLPTLSKQITSGDAAGYKSTLEKTIRVITGLTIPIAVILAVNLKPVIVLLGFDTGGTNLVLWTVRGFLVGLVGHSLLEVSARAFYARQNAKTPLLASAAASVTFLVLAIPLSRQLGAPGIGLANSLAYTGETLLLFFLLYRIMPYRPRLTGTLLRALGASLVGIGLSLGLQYILGDPQSTLAGVGIASLIILLASAQIIPWQLPEIKDLLKI